MSYKFQKLEIYQLALDYLDLLYELSARLPRSEEYNLKSQTPRAGTSIVLNIAEGSTSQTDPEQSRFLAMALRSLIETVACQDVIERRKYLSDDRGRPRTTGDRGRPATEDDRGPGTGDRGRTTGDQRPSSVVPSTVSRRLSSVACLPSSVISMEETIIEPGRGFKHYWRDLWAYRELFYFLAWRDIAVRYKQTVIGVAWSLVRPFLTMVVFTLVFGKLAKLPSGNTPYPILVFAAMLPWQFFSNALTASSESLVGSANMISKVYFPRLAIPTSAVIVSFVDFLLSFAMLLVLMAWYQFIPSWRMVALPLLTLLAFCAAMGVGLWFASLNVKYRDFRFIVPFVVQFGIYVSPVGFSSSIVPAKWRLLYSLNPMVGVIDGFRWAIIGGEAELYLPGFLMSIALVALLLTSGIWYFRRTERTFADVI
jgi:lipopolysaccharide transport system permease protein